MGIRFPPGLSGVSVCRLIADLGNAWCSHYPYQDDNVSWSAVGNRDPPIRDYFQKTEIDLTRSCSQRLGGYQEGVGRFLSTAPLSAIRGKSGVSALRKFFAVLKHCP
jgi:hypothetical protein